MRSVCDEIWLSHCREAGLIASEAERERIACPAPNQERVLAAAEVMSAIYRLFSGDATALRIITRRTSGMAGESIPAMHRLSSLAYDSVRRRIQRRYFGPVYPGRLHELAA